jgi:hypothetical protein
VAFLGNFRKHNLGLVRVAVAFVLVCTVSAAWSETVSETEAKATFLYHFTQFVAWPARSLPKDTSSFVIGILGEDPFGVILDQTIQDEVVEGRKIVVERYPNLGSIKSCQILFISRSEERRLDEIFNALKDKPVLTVADMPECARRGGTITLITEHNKIRIVVNVATTQAHQLTFSSKLLRAAEVIER